MLIVSIQLNDPRIHWVTKRSPELDIVAWGRGHAFLDGVYYEDMELVNKIIGQCNKPSVQEQICAFKGLIPMLDGCWALVMQACDGTVIAAVDRSRSIPLFYFRTSNGYVIADAPDTNHNKKPKLNIDPVSAAEFLLSGYVSGKETLYKNVFQIQPGEFVEFPIDRPSAKYVPHRYFQYFPKDVSANRREELEEEIEQILETTFARLAGFLKGKTVILPLSGGYDSRLIAWMLKKHGVDNVLCYTYGVAANPERVIAEQVAKTLGFEWRFIEYNAERWAKCMSSPEMSGYWDYAFRGTSSPHLQDFPAVMELTKEFHSGAPLVFLPGHVADSWAGYQVLKSMEERASLPPTEYHSDYVMLRGCLVVSAIVHHHLSLWPVAPRLWDIEPWRSVARKIHDNVLAYENPRGYGVWTYAEWALRSRLALWLVNACRCFEYFGGTFMLPLGTNELIGFLARLPKGLVIDSEFYTNTLSKRVLGSGNHLLCNIPIRSSSVHYKGDMAKRVMVDILLNMRLYKPLDRLRRSFRSPRGLHAESWFARNHRPERITIGEGLSTYQVEHYLPAELVQVIRPFLRRPLYSIQCNGLLTAVVLAKEYARSEG